MITFDPASHTNLLPFRECLRPWWDSRPADVVGLVLYGSRAKGCAEQYSDWDLVVFTSTARPDADKICRNLPRVFDEAPVHALCESIDHVKSNAVFGGSLVSAIAEQGVSLFGATIPFKEDTIKQPSYDAAETLLSASLESLKGFLSEANIRHREQLKHDKDATTHSVHLAEYLVKSFMSVRGINFQRSHNVKELCDQIAKQYPRDPLLKQLRRLDGFTAQGHLGPYQFLFVYDEPLDRTTKRVYRALALLPPLTTEIFAVRQTPNVTHQVISRKLAVLHEDARRLENRELQAKVQTP